MSYTPRPIKNYIANKSFVEAIDINDIVARLQRLESLTVSPPLSKVDSIQGSSISLLHKIPDIEFAELTEDVTDDESLLFSATLLTQNQSGTPDAPDNTYPFNTYTGRTIQCRNIFKIVASSGDNVAVVRFPRQVGEWILIAPFATTSGGGGGAYDSDIVMAYKEVYTIPLTVTKITGFDQCGGYMDAGGRWGYWDDTNDRIFINTPAYYEIGYSFYGYCPDYHTSTAGERHLALHTYLYKNNAVKTQTERVMTWDFLGYHDIGGSFYTHRQDARKYHGYCHWTEYISAAQFIDLRAYKAYDIADDIGATMNEINFWAKPAYTE